MHTSVLDRHGVIEVDTFCTGCNYNLHGQVVTIDARLGFPICRCPECGKFHPAGTGVTSSSVWVRRFAAALLGAWVGTVICGAMGVVGVFFVLSLSSVETFAYEIATSSAPNHWRFQMQLHDWRLPTTPDVSGLSIMVLISIGSLICGFIAGALCVTLLWHWNRPRYFYVVLLPLIAAALLVAMYHSMVDHELIRVQSIERVASQTGIQCLGVLIGIVLGRKVSRAIVMMVIPPKPRQSLAFLWRADGKNLPVE